jgi:hypothetical protein
MYLVRNPAGRLVTLRLASPVDLAECQRAVDDIQQVLSGVVGKARIATDLTRARTFPQEVADRFTRLMKADNPKVERSAFLLSSTGATFGLQIERMIREAASPSRRSFLNPSELVAWLADVCDRQEQEEITRFFNSAW